jgi:hypothetical protein
MDIGSTLRLAMVSRHFEMAVYTHIEVGRVFVHSSGVARLLDSLGRMWILR